MSKHSSIRSIRVWLLSTLALFLCNISFANETYVSAVGIGVSNLEQSIAFYTDGLNMRELHRDTSKHRTEVVLESADATGPKLKLISYTDSKERVFNQNPGKIVFYAHDANAFAATIASSGGQILLPPTPQETFGGALVGFGRDPDNNLIEIVGYPPAKHSILAGFGIGVSDLEAAKDFYVNRMGLKVDQYLEIPGQYNEYILESHIPDLPGIVLMNWTNGTDQNYINNPIELEFEAADPRHLLHAIKKSENTSDKQFKYSRRNHRKNQIQDIDGHVIQVNQSNLSFLGAAGIGVPDLETAITFFCQGLGMKEINRRERKNRIEAVLQSADGRGSNIVLMEFTDGKERNFTQNPGKLVFYVKDPSAFASDITSAGGTILLPPSAQEQLGGIVVGFGRGINYNLIEIVGAADATESYFSAFGIGVSDLEAAKTFYTNKLGLKESQYLETASYDEYILEGESGSALVLMHWTDGRPVNYSDNPVKVELHHIAPKSLTKSLMFSGENTVKRPKTSKDPGLDGVKIGSVKDADGTLIEIFNATWKKTE